MLCVQNVCVEPILISLNPSLTESEMILVSPHHSNATRGMMAMIIIIQFYNLPLPFGQTAQTVSSGSMLFVCSTIRTLHSRLPTPLFISLHIARVVGLV